MKLIELLGSVALAALATTGTATAAQPAAPEAADFKASADAIVQAAYPADGPGAAVVVTRGGRVIYAAGRGLADIEARRPITPATPFKLASIVKQFTAAIILQLVAEGRIALDDPIARFFPDFPQPAARATVRQLLNHTSGILDYSKIPGWIGRAGTRPFTTAELVAEVRGQPAKTEPGAAWEYNNAGYMMLGAIVEQVTGKPWHAAVRERIAKPLGLTSIVFGGDAEGGAALARGYGREGGAYRPATTAHASVAHGSGGLVGSAEDLAKWADALHHGRVVSPALYQEMIRPAPLTGGKTAPYGFGLRLRELRGRPALVHGGAGRGIDTDTVYIPSQHIYVAVLANSDGLATDSSILTRRLAALALGEPFPLFARAEVAAGTLEPMFGVYQAMPGGSGVRFFGRDGKFYIASGDGEMEAIPAGGDRFFLARDGLTWFSIARQADGAHVMELHEPEAAAPERAVRTGDLPPPVTVPPAVLRSYVGTYATETLVVTVALAENGWLTMTPAGQDPLPMRPVSDTEFRIESGSMRVVFHPENGAVDRFTMHRGARELHGRRTGR